MKAIAPDLKPDWVVVPALKATRPELLVPALERPDVGQAKAQLRRWHSEGVPIGASCVGSFLLADAGLLDHQESNDDLVARAAFSAALSECLARRDPYACAVGCGCYSRRRNGAS